MKVQLILTVIFGVLESVLYAGALYGWASLQPILVQEGFFSGSCSAPDEGGDVNVTSLPFSTAPSGDVDAECSAQVEQLNLVFTVITSIPPVIAIGFGAALNRFGNWITRTLILLIFAAGLLLTALATPQSSWLLFVSLSLCNLAAYGLLFANISLANLVPYYRASIVTLMSGAFDSGTLVFLLFYELYKIGCAFDVMFYSYAGLVVVFLAQTFFLTPRRPTPFVLPDNYRYGYREMRCFGAAKEEKKEEEEQKEAEVEEKSSKVGEYTEFDLDDSDNPDNQTLADCFRQVYTYTELLHYCVVHFAVTYFIGSFNSWIATKVDPDDIDLYTTAFGATQGLGIVFAPFSGMLIDYFRRKYARKIGLGLGSLKSVTLLLIINDAFVILMLALSLIPSAELQFLTMALQVIARAFVYSTAAAFANAVYPTHQFGVMYGLTEALGGVVLLIQYPLTLLLTRLLDNNFSLVNGALLGLCILSLLHPAYLLRLVSRRSRKRRKSQLKTRM